MALTIALPALWGYLMLISKQGFEMIQLTGIPIRFGGYFSMKRSFLIYVLFVFFPLQMPGPCLAESPGDQATVSETVIIESKGDGGIIISKRRYAVMEATTILDVSGKKITLCDLRVPSEALVEYQLKEDQDPVCIKIANKQLLEGATSLVIADDPG